VQREESLDFETWCYSRLFFAIDNAFSLLTVLLHRFPKPPRLLDFASVLRAGSHTFSALHYIVIITSHHTLHYIICFLGGKGYRRTN
jgi:hypothetical protein